MNECEHDWSNWDYIILARLHTRVCTICGTAEYKDDPDVWDIRLPKIPLNTDYFDEF